MISRIPISVIPRYLNASRVSNAFFNNKKKIKLVVSFLNQKPHKHTVIKNYEQLTFNPLMGEKVAGDLKSCR